MAIRRGKEMFEIAISGDLPREMEREKRKVERAMKSTMEKGSKLLRDALRRQVASAGLGTGLQKAWKAQAWPKGQDSANAAATVFSKAPHIHDGYDRGETIRSKNGSWIAIASENAPKRVGRKKIRPSNFPESRFGRLRFIAPRGRNDLALLVVDKLRKRRGKRGGYTRASRTALRRGDYENSVVMFWLVPQAKMKKKLNVAAAAKAAEDRHPHLLAAEFERLDRADGSDR